MSGGLSPGIGRKGPVNEELYQQTAVGKYYYAVIAAIKIH
jgi:hypothetical protein